MKKLYAGLAAAAIVTSGIACGAGAAGATEAVPSSLGYVPGSAISTAVSADGTVYTAAVNESSNGIDVSSTTAAGVTTHGAVALTPAAGLSIYDVYSVVVTSTGTVAIAAEQRGDVAGESVADQGIWVAQVDGTADAIEVAAGVATATEGATASASADGSHGALAADDHVTVVDADGSEPTTVSLGTDAYAEGVAVGNDGTAYVFGTDAGGQAVLSVRAGSKTVTKLSVQNGAQVDSLAVAGTKLVVGETLGTDDDPTYALEVFGGGSPASVVVPDRAAVLTAATDDHTVFASEGTYTERVDLDHLASYTEDSPVIDGYLTDDISSLAATTDSLYAAASAWVQDDNGDYHRSAATLTRISTPGAVTDATQTVYSDEIDLDWTAPAEDGGADITYVVTATDKATGKVITDRTEDVSDVLRTADGLQADHSYDITVRAENFAFAGAEATVAPLVPGASTVTVTGNPVVGGKLTGNVNNKWPEGTELSYQWGYSGGEYGGAIEGAEGLTYTPTADMVGMTVTLYVTASLKDHSDVRISSTPVRVVAAANTSTTTTQAPTSAKASTIKSSAKKVTVTLAGVTGSAPGKVKVYDGKKLIGKATIKDGKVTLKLKKHLAKGKHHLTMKYAGSAQVAAFHQKATLKVK